MDVAEQRNPTLLRRYLRTLAASTTGTPATERLLEAASIDRATAAAYDDVLDLLKATAAPTTNDARHLRWLRDRIGDRFVRGIVFHTGPRSFQHQPDIWYLPISALRR